MLEEDINTNTDIVTVEAEDVVEESPLLVAQRYLNIFRQIHIFKASKKAEFDNELLNLPEKIKRILINLPGGRILLEHILELEEKNNYDASFTKLLIAQKKKQDSSDALLPTSQQTTGGVSGELKIGSDFANVLARSLATALGNNTLPQPFNASGLPSVSTSADGKQINTQNNAAATTVNNINVDYSVFKNLADAINKSNSQAHDDFMKVVDALNQNFNPTIVQTDGIPLSAITSSLTQVLRENSRQQLEEMKTFSKTLTDAILGKSDTAQPTEKNDMSKTSGFNTEPKHIAKQNITQRSASGVQNNSKTQTISVTNRSVNPLTSQSSVQKKTYSIPADTAPINDFQVPKPKPKADPILQAQNVLSRTSLSVKPISLSDSEPVAPVSVQQTPNTAPEQQNTAQKKAEIQNITPKQQPSDDDGWEYVDEYGNPVSDDDGWEYVDEYGNPVSDDGWEYVEEEYEIKPDDSTLQVAKQPEKNQESNKIQEKDSAKTENQINTSTIPPEKKDEQITPEAQDDKKQNQNEEVRQDSSKVSKNEDNEIKEKSKGLLSSLFKKKAKTEDNAEVKAKDEVKEETKEEDKSANDALAAAFGAPKEETKEENKSADDALAAAFGTPKEETKEEDKSANDALAAAFGAPKEETKKEDKSADDALAAAFSTPKEETKEEDKSADDALAAAFSTPKEETKEEDKSADDALAAAFGAPKEETKEEPKPKMGGLLAEAFQEIEKEQKNISSKDLLNLAKKNKPQTSEELLSSVYEKKYNDSDKNKSADDALAAAFGAPKEETKEENKSADDALAAAFGAPKEETKKEDKSADDALAAAFGAPKEAKEESEGKGKYSEEFDALLKAFQS